MPTPSRSQALMRGMRRGARTARLVFLSMFLPTKILTDMAEADRLDRSRT